MKMNSLSARLSRRELLTAALSGGIAAAQSPQNAFRGARAGDRRNVEGVRLCWCPPGRFLMGSPSSEPGHRPDEAQVEVELSRGYWMAEFEASQGEWKRFVGDFPDKQPTAEFGLGDTFPVYWVNYAQAENFCERLTARAHSSGMLPETWQFRLPTEAQWEYACRAGTTTMTAYGDRLGMNQANFKGQPLGGGKKLLAANRATPVGRYRGNAWGLCDMHGNIFEWCRDWYHARLPGGMDPDLSETLGEQNGDGTYSRCRRGGAWNDPGEFCRSAFRLRYEPERNSDHIGFRVAAVEA